MDNLGLRSLGGAWTYEGPAVSRIDINHEGRIVTSQDEYIERVRSAAIIAGHDSTVAVRTVLQVQKDFPIADRHGRRGRRLTRKAAIQSGMVANDLPGWVRMLGEFAKHLPGPYGLAVAAIIWAYETFLAS
jgi:hypothetical protein